MVTLEASRYEDHLDDSDQEVMRDDGYFQKLVLLVEKSNRLEPMISGII